MIYINDFFSVSALGSSVSEISAALADPYRNYLIRREDLLPDGKSSYFGMVKEELPDLGNYPEHNTRNNALMAKCLTGVQNTLNLMFRKYAPERIGVVTGTSTSGLSETEAVLKDYLSSGTVSPSFNYNYQEYGDLSIFVSKYLKTKGPAYTISTACSSSAKALISGYRLIAANLADVVIAGGCDTLCQVPINGFNSMGVLSAERCLPFCRHRNGINIGEAAGVMILSRDPGDLFLAGFGESSDAYHISSPDPSGEGAYTSMSKALAMANITPEDLGYINLHGTATRLNDDMEARAVARLTGKNVPCSSTKYLTGHTLGAAGILESCILATVLKYDLPLPVQDFLSDEIDPALPECGLIRDPVKAKSGYMMSNSFAFGGNNASIIIGRNKNDIS